MGWIDRAKKAAGNAGKRVIYHLSKVFWLFPLKKDKLFLMNFDGTFVGHDAKAFVEYCQENGIRMDFVWAAKNKAFARKLSLHGVRFVPVNSLKGWYEALTAKTLLYNINPPSYLAFRKDQTLINTWHGYPYKYCGRHLPNFNKRQFNTTTCFLTDADSCTRVTIRDHFQYEGEVLECGTPRTDVFYTDKKDRYAAKVRQRLGLPKEKRIVLYTPTFRGNFVKHDTFLDIERLKKALSRRFSGEWTVLMRLHPMIARKFDSDMAGAVDVSLYEDTQELLCAADVLITDYSSTNWDFSLMKRPVFLFADDTEAYYDSRRMTVPIERMPFSIASNNDELERNILAFDPEEYTPRVEKYMKDLGNRDLGHCCPELVQYIREHGARC